MKRMFTLLLRAFLKLMDSLWAFGAVAVCTAWWIGVLYKDEHRATLWLYFIPSIAVVIFGLIWMLLTLRHRFRVIQLYVFFTMIACFVKVLVIDHAWNRPPKSLPHDNLRILHWNTAWGALGVESIVRTMQLDEPDIIMISEPPRLDMISDIAYHALGMEHIFTDAGMTVASHFPITYLGSIPLDAGVAWHVRIDTEHGPLEFIAADIISRPNLNRHGPLKGLAHWIASRTNQLPVIMVGDFNTPHDSDSLRPLRKLMRNAYEVKGRGWPYTWPVPFPVFAIDHTWIGRNITVNDYHLKVARYSDHKRQIADISLPPNSGQRTEAIRP